MIFYFKHTSTLKNSAKEDLKNICWVCLCVFSKVIKKSKSHPRLQKKQQLIDTQSSQNENNNSMKKFSVKYKLFLDFFKKQVFENDLSMK